MNPWVVPVVVMVAVAFAAWLIAAISFFAMFGHAKGGWSKLVFSMDWWWPSRVADHVEPGGLKHHRRFLKAFGWFFAAVFGLIAMGVLQTVISL